MLNQAPTLVDYNVFRGDRALVDALAHEGASSALDELDQIGILAGSAQAQEWARVCNQNPPQLRTHDRYGNRIDEVDYHPYYHELMNAAVRFGLHGAPWTSDDPVAHTARAAKFYVWGQVEAGHGCPISMTYAGVPALRVQPQVARVWEAALCRPQYDPRLLPVNEKLSALCGMALTEKQGGSDVRSNRTAAVFAEHTNEGDAYLLSGHKWFCSAPMSDAFLVLARADAGLTCFLMPRVLPDGTRNRMVLVRLKDKLGNRSNASSEIELEQAWALRVGEEGNGIPVILEMVNFTRLDCMNGSAALMRAATTQAIHHARYRHAFGRALIDQPLMQNVLADLAVESQASMLFLLRIARSVDRAVSDPREALIKRLGTAVGKYFICKRAPVIVAEALECLGGNGYVEDSGMPRLYREAPLNSIWEGCGNVNALDVLRVIRKQPEALDAFHEDIAPALGDARLRTAAKELLEQTRDSSSLEARARMLVERLAVLWQAALFMRDVANPATELFIDSRLHGRWGHALGTLAPSNDHRLVIEHAQSPESVEYINR
jgi:putative acyl-CoA dehydrogenase